MLKAPRFCRGAFRLRRREGLAPPASRCAITNRGRGKPRPYVVLRETSTAEGQKDVGISTKFAEYYFLLLPKLEDPSQIFLDILNAVIAGNSGL